MNVEIKGKKKNGNKNETSISEKLDRLTSMVEEIQNWRLCTESYPVKNLLKVENKTLVIPITNSSNLDGWTFGNYRTVILDYIFRVFDFRHNTHYDL